MSVQVHLEGRDAQGWRLRTARGGKLLFGGKKFEDRGAARSFLEDANKRLGGGRWYLDEPGRNKSRQLSLFGQFEN